MRKKIKILLLLSSLFYIQLSLHAIGSTQKRVSFYPETPRTGENLKIEFDAKGGDLEYSDDINVMLHVLTNGRWLTKQFPMKHQSEKWEIEYTLPEGSSFLALKFFQGDIAKPDIADNNDDKAYFTAILSKTGKPQQGNAIGQAILLTPRTSDEAYIHNYYVAPPAPQPEIIKELLKKEEKINGSQWGNYLVPYLKLQKVILGTDFGKYAENFLTKELAKKNLSEDYLANLYSFFAYSQRDSILGNKVGDRILTAYPKSRNARLVSHNRIRMMSPDPYKNIASIEDFLKKYPVAEWRKNPDQRGYIYYTLYRVLGSAYFDTRQFDKFNNLYNDFDFKTGNEVARWNIFRAYTFETVGKDTLYQISSHLMPYLLKNKNDNSFFEDFPESKEAAQKNADKQLDERLFTHISLLNDLGKYEEARKSFFDLSPEGKYATADLNEINLHVIEKLNLQNEILPHLEMSVKYNAVTPKMLEKLKEIYLSKHANSSEGFDEYVASLKSDEEKETMRKYVESHITSYPMPNFELENADGSMVSSEQLKDKIVVIDFWATWCRPCIMAFPGMQLVTDKYMQDPQVRIYLVGTMQSGDYKEKSVNFVKKSGYRFNMLHDAINPKTGEQDFLFKQLTPFFESSAIPRKIIVKNGVIRYSSEGYSGSPSKLLDEISLAIDLLKNE